MKLLKKAQVGGLQGFILSIITVGIVLAIGLIILGELGTLAKEMDTSSVINESLASGSYLTEGGLLIGASACRNASMNAHVIGQNCNISSGGLVTLDPLNFTGNGFIDYTHWTPSASFNSTGTILTKLATVPTWIGIIIIIALAFIVLSFFIEKRQ